MNGDDRMYNVGDYVVYKKEVCLVKDYLKEYRKGLDYYSLVPLSDDSLKIILPVNSSSLKNILTKEEVDRLINNIPNIGVIEVEDRLLESEYKKLLRSDNYEGLIAIIKTTYLRNKKRLASKKKISDKDSEYFNLAERLLYTEFAVALHMSYEEVKDYVVLKVEELL